MANAVNSWLVVVLLLSPPVGIRFHGWSCCHQSCSWLLLLCVTCGRVGAIHVVVVVVIVVVDESRGVVVVFVSLLLCVCYYWHSHRCDGAVIGTTWRWLGPRNSAKTTRRRAPQSSKQSSNQAKKIEQNDGWLGVVSKSRQKREN